MRCRSELTGLLSWEQGLNALAALSDKRWKSCNCSDLFVLSVHLLIGFPQTIGSIEEILGMQLMSLVIVGLNAVI